MFLAIVLNLASAAVVVGGWALTVWALYHGLGRQPDPAAGLYTRRLRTETACLSEAALPGKRAA